MTRVAIEEIQKDVPGYLFLWFILTIATVAMRVGRAGGETA